MCLVCDAPFNLTLRAAANPSDSAAARPATECLRLGRAAAALPAHQRFGQLRTTVMTAPYSTLQNALISMPTPCLPSGPVAPAASRAMNESISSSSRSTSPQCSTHPRARRSAQLLTLRTSEAHGRAGVMCCSILRQRGASFRRTAPQTYWRTHAMCWRTRTQADTRHGCVRCTL